MIKLTDKYLPADYCDSVSKRIKPDKPLSPDYIFEQMFCNFAKPVDGWQDASVTTVVKFNNFQGRLYFIGIWMFHKLLVGILFRKAVR